MPYRQRYTPGPTGMRILRTAVASGEFICRTPGEVYAARTLNGNGLLRRPAVRVFRPTGKGIALIRERDGSNQQGAME